MLNKTPLLIMASVTMAGMTGLLVWSSLEHSLFALPETLTQSRWFITTCVDAYLALLFFSLWAYSRESTMFSRLFWPIMIMGLGNVATAAYLIRRLLSMPQQFTLWEFIAGPRTIPVDEPHA